MLNDMAHTNCKDAFRNQTNSKTGAASGNRIKKMDKAKNMHQLRHIFNYPETA
jgi:hypothetical protein